MSAVEPPLGRPSLTYAAVKDGDNLSDRRGDGPCCTCPASCDACAASTARRARYFLPKRLDGAHEAIRAYFALYGS